MSGEKGPLELMKVNGLMDKLYKLDNKVSLGSFSKSHIHNLVSITGKGTLVNVTIQLLYSEIVL
jgi:hypothetical protein